MKESSLRPLIPSEAQGFSMHAISVATWWIGRIYSLHLSQLFPITQDQILKKKISKSMEKFLENDTLCGIFF